jgi:hypothetical protein
MGRDGVLWRIAHAKIRPLWAVKAGDDGGPVPLADYDDDYALFTWTQTDDRDAREVADREVLRAAGRPHAVRDRVERRGPTCGSSGSPSAAPACSRPAGSS